MVMGQFHDPSRKASLNGGVRTMVGLVGLVFAVTK